MAHLIYEKATGRIDSVREQTAGGVKSSGPEIVENIFGVGAAEFFGALRWFGAFPVGKMVKAGAVVADPDYVPPAPPAVPVPPVV